MLLHPPKGQRLTSPMTGDTNDQRFCMDSPGEHRLLCVLPVGHDPLSSLPHQSSDQGWDRKTRHGGPMWSSQRVRSTSSNF